MFRRLPRPGSLSLFTIRQQTKSLLLKPAYQIPIFEQNQLIKIFREELKTLKLHPAPTMIEKRDPQVVHDFEIHTKHLTAIQTKKQTATRNFIRELKLKIANSRSEKTALEVRAIDLQLAHDNPSTSAEDRLILKAHLQALHQTLNRYRYVLILTRGEMAEDIRQIAERMGMIPLIAHEATDSDSLAVVNCLPEHRIRCQNYHDVEEAKRIVLNMLTKCGDTFVVQLGYGPLSESADFMAFCETHHITVASPASKPMRIAGSKLESKNLMQAHGVPIIPGYYGNQQDPEFLWKEALNLGLPVMVKKENCGGGIGNRIINNKDEFDNFVSGNSRFAIEELTNPLVFEHIECQLFIDDNGAVFLGARNCGLQKRNKKYAERGENDPQTLKHAHDYGLQAGEALHKAGYRGAATIEFLVKNKTIFYFMEINPRVQVEHTLTDKLTNISILELTLLLAQGRDCRPLINHFYTNEAKQYITGHADQPLYSRQLRLNAVEMTVHEGIIHIQGLEGPITELVVPKDTKDQKIRLGVQVGTQLSYQSRPIDPLIALVFGYSNISQEDADRKALAHAAKFQLKLNGKSDAEALNLPLTKFVLEAVHEQKLKETIGTGPMLEEEYAKRHELKQEATASPGFRR